MVSGYISYQCLDQKSYTYQITFYNYANTCNDAYDQDTVTFYFGDGSHQVVARSNGPINSDGFPDGVSVCTCRKLCIYTCTHQYPGPSVYRIHVDDPARMANISNMIGSGSVNFYVFSTLIISPFISDSLTAPVVTNPLCCVYACPNSCYYYNLGAYSPSGDSLAYVLGTCLGSNGGTAPGYFLPNVTSLDTRTGILKWCSPASAGGIYNFAIDIVCYKKVPSGNHYEYLVADTTECELEILVDTCSNKPPVVTGPTDTCVIAGNSIQLNYIGTDPDHEPVDISASGPSFSASPPSTYTSTSPGDPVSLTFRWTTNCSDVSSSPYPLLITATDLPTLPPSLNAYQSTSIYVVGPAPTNLTVTNIGNEDSLHWDPSICPQVTGYSIYRHEGCSKLDLGPCVTGVPGYTGYVLIGTTTGLDNTTFIDNNGGTGLVPGASYDYTVIANYPLPDGSESLAAKDTCVTIKRDAPVILNVSVDSTASGTGKIYVRWTKPLPDTANLDTIKNPGPYKYILQRATGISGKTFSPVVTYTAPFFRSFIDTAFKDSLLSTYSTGYNYRVDFYSGGNSFKGSSATASSIYLVVKPDNNELHLSWNSLVPWTDDSFNIYRKYPCGTCLFKLIATVPGTQVKYDDTVVTNGTNYCYYIKSKSQYPDTTIFHPLFDSSEIMCGIPKDTIPPCSPLLRVMAKCDTYTDSLVWNNPDHFCKKTDNILLYRIYFSPTSGGDMQLVATITNLNDTVLVHDSLNSVAGCWAVTAVDSEMYESPLDTICVDDCPLYVLPNVFTPNGDGDNDFFTPLIPYRYIKDIDINIYNRWGQVMFHTLDPRINWDGKDQNTHGECPDGVYYYICQVHEIHVTGIQTITLRGFVQLIR
jgi:gliding motility-associated-like protein